MKQQATTSSHMDRMRMNRGQTSPARREEITRAVLTASIELSHNELARQVGVSRECVRQVRSGQLYRSYCPDLPRLAPGVLQLSCNDCVHFVRERLRRRVNGIDRTGGCGLGIPECTEGFAFARGCGAFAHALEIEA